MATKNSPGRSKICWPSMYLVNHFGNLMYGYQNLMDCDQVTAIHSTAFVLSAWNELNESGPQWWLLRWSGDARSPRHPIQVRGLIYAHDGTTSPHSSHAALSSRRTVT